MKFCTIRTILCLALIMLFVSMFTSTAMAAPHLNWVTTAVYFDASGKPIISGYFHNDGTVPIDKVNYIRQQIYLQKGGSDYFFVAAGTWYNINLFLRPGDVSHKYRLQITEYSGMVYDFDGWRTRGDVNYHIAAIDET